MDSLLLPWIMAVSILLQFVSAGLAVYLIWRSGFFLPWIPLAAAIFLMGIRRLISFLPMLRRESFPLEQLGPELVALGISLLMTAGLIFMIPAFHRLTQRHSEDIRHKNQQIQETHHRVKNDLQLLQSLVAIQEMEIRSPRQKLLLRDLSLRIQTFYLLHRTLFSAEGLNSKEYLNNLAETIHQSCNPGDFQLSCTFEDVDFITHQLLNIGLIMNEAMTNAYKYAGRQSNSHRAFPRLEVSLLNTDGRNRALFVVKDNGPGIPADVLGSERRSFGINLIHSLCEGAGWQLDIDTSEGTCIQIHLPAEREV